MGELVEDAVFSKHRARLHQQNIDYLFSHALSLEESKPWEAMRLYEKILSINPADPYANINLGTICYNNGKLLEAKCYYMATLAASPDYALAHFDLGNVHDELGDCNAAIAEYEAAIRLCSDYADAHFNLALVYVKINKPRKAIPHWLRYMKLDPSSGWHINALISWKKLLAADCLKIVYRNQKMNQKPR